MLYISHDTCPSRIMDLSEISMLGLQVGGYVVEYENLMFVTIRGSGHFVPSYQPARALALFSSFINQKLLPSK